MTFVVIMAGGSGERFWPVSRMTKPKQLLKLTHPTKHMLQEAVDRITPVVPIENILVITSEVLRQPIIDSMPGLPANNVIAEPAKRNTAPCLALGARIIRERAGADDVMAVLTADHFIGDAKQFCKDVEDCISFAENNDALVTIGIRPTRPETGYGYIEVAQEGADDIVPVKSFTEKPDAATALEYLQGGRYLWNSGMFFWKVSALKAAMDQHMPQVGAFISIDANTEEAFKDLPDISIDYGVMERADNVFVKQASFPWDDVGAWDALARMRTTDDHSNVSDGNVVLEESSNNVVINASTSKHVVTSVGLRDHIVVVTDDATMVAPKSRSQDVKKIVSALRKNGSSDVL